MHQDIDPDVEVLDPQDELIGRVFNVVAVSMLRGEPAVMLAARLDCSVEAAQALMERTRGDGAVAWVQ